MGLSTSKTKTNQTQTPVVSEPYSSAFKDYTGMIGDFLAKDPTTFVAPASELQNKAFADAQGLGTYKPYLDAASAGAASATGPANLSQAAQVGKVATYGGAHLGPATLYGGAELADPAMIYQHMGDYQDPYTKQVIDASLADYDQYAGQQRAAQEAGAARTAAFGGSRYGIAQGQLEGELSRGRNSIVSNLLNQGWLNSAQLAGQDVGAINQFLTQRALLAQQAGLSNQDAANNFALNQAQFSQQAGLSNAAAKNAAAAQQANLSQQTNLANQQAQNEQYQRQLQAAALQAQLAQTASSSELADLSATAALGDTQRQIASAYTNAYPTQLQLAGKLYSELYPGIYAGQNTQGTTTTNQAWGPLLAQAAGAAAQAAAIAF